MTNAATANLTTTTALGYALLAGCAGAGSAQLLELELLDKTVGPADALAAMCSSMLLGAALLALTAAACMLTRRVLRRPHVLVGPAWSLGAAASVFVACTWLGCSIYVGALFDASDVGTLLKATVVSLPIASLCAGALVGKLVPSSPSDAALQRAHNLALLCVPILLCCTVALSTWRSHALPLALAAAAGAAVLAGLSLLRLPRALPLAAPVAWLACTLATLPTFHAAPAKRITPPKGSVIFVVLDTTRADALGAYGARTNATPVFDRLAREGTLYEEMISEAPWTLPSHATFFTGLSPREHECWFGGQRWLDDRFETVAERFKAKGYDTAAFYGNGWLAVTNMMQGFTTNVALTPAYDDLSLTWLMRHTGLGFSRWIDRGASEAVSAIDQWMSQRQQDKPFFLFLNLFEAHEPYVSPIAFHHMPKGIGEIDGIRALRHYNEQMWHVMGRSAGFEQDVIRALYQNGIRYQDAMLQQLTDVVSSHYVLDQLAVVIAADHGENLGEGGRWGHQFALNDKLIHVPLIIRAPSRVAVHARTPGAFSSVDIASTLLDLGGLDTRLGSGQSLISLPNPRDTTFAEDYPYYTTLHLAQLDFRHDLGDLRWPLSAVRWGGYKLVVWHNGTTLLYDLRSDPAEAHDIAMAHPDIVEQLRSKLTGYWQAHPRGNRQATDANGQRKALNRQTAQQLHTLGYL
ncbi:MAG TPA: sulfatase [Polyangiales bacterium]